MVVIFQLLVPILIVAQTPFIPESPRWYVKKGKLEAARESLSRVRDTEQDVADELLMIREAIEDTILHVPNPPGVEGDKAVLMPKGAQVTIDMVGVRAYLDLDAFYPVWRANYGL